jgi:hypothetical protein
VYATAERAGVPVPPDFLLLIRCHWRAFHQSPDSATRMRNCPTLRLPPPWRPSGRRDVEMLGGIVEGLLKESNRHPWEDGLRSPAQGRTLPTSSTHPRRRSRYSLPDCLGEAQAPLLPERLTLGQARSEFSPIEALFDESCRRDRREPQVRFAQLRRGSAADGLRLWRQAPEPGRASGILFQPHCTPERRETCCGPTYTMSPPHNY